MSEFKRWMTIAEQLAPTVINSKPTDTLFVENEIVLISPASGGGVGRFVACVNGACTIDVKGILMELPIDSISRLPTEGKDPFDSPNDKMHINITGNTAELLRDKPDPQCGDIVRVENVYGSGIGPGYGVFMSYSTTGKEAVISFDDRTLTVPVEQISSVVEQEAEDEFNTTGNDGALSPMSLGSQNRQLTTTDDGDIAMSQKDQFSKWIKAVEEGLRDEADLGEPECVELSACSCQSWDCPICYKDDDKVVTASHSPLSVDDLRAAAARSPSVLVLDDIFNEDEYSDHEFNNNTADYAPGLRDQSPSPDAIAEPGISDASEDVSELIGKIQYMQDMGLSASDKYYDPDQLIDISNPAVIKRIYDKVMGNVTESAEPSAAEFFGYADDKAADVDVAVIDTDETDDEPSLIDSLSSIEKKIAIAKAALDHKKVGVDEDDVTVDPVDHGLRSLGNKIVNAKLKHSGKEANSVATEEEDMLVPDPEIMEWVARFAARDKIVQENTDRSPKTTGSSAGADTGTSDSAVDEETLAWMKRFNNLDKK